MKNRNLKIKYLSFNFSKETKIEYSQNFNARIKYFMNFSDIVMSVAFTEIYKKTLVDLKMYQIYL